MIFGYYTVAVERYTAAQVAHLFKIDATEHVEKAVKLGHLLFIPFIPMEKMWVLNSNGERFKIKYEVAQQLERHFGALRSPWWAFAGLYLVAILYTGYSIQSKLSHNKFTNQLEEKAQQVFADRVALLQAPTVHDYYTLKHEYQPFLVKVNGFTQDSIEFLVPTPIQAIPPGDDRHGFVAYLNEPDAATVSRKLAKADIEQHFASHADWNTPTSAINHDIWSYLVGKPAIFDNVERFHADTVQQWRYNNAQVVEVKSAFQAYMAAINDIHATIPLLDEATIAFFSTMLETAITGDIKQMKAFVDNSEVPLVTLKLMLYTQYSYLEKSQLKPGQLLSKQTLEDYFFFLKLVEQGLWTVDFGTDIARSIEISNVRVFSNDSAQVDASLNSNILMNPTRVHFKIRLQKEGEQWKINVPSTFSYTKIQIGLATTGGGTNTKAEYKKMVIEEVNKHLSSDGQSDKKTEVALEWYL